MPQFFGLSATGTQGTRRCFSTSFVVNRCAAFASGSDRGMKSGAVQSRPTARYA
ncbi:hypothetical protein ABT301_33555 [Streptomyces sp. NPDC000987]|uniref:hypothetical protein n=1 Tax=Streptomyces sp. NPDC000987 TaxID=3154374 RepID=UPI0033226714